MQTDYQRYAIYFVPRPGSELAHFGREWLGTDSEARIVNEAPSAFVDSPRRYGFHATLKAPMRLSEKSTYADFRLAVKCLADQLKPVDLGQLQLKRIGSFLALMTSDEYHPSIADLAWTCVTELDPFRANLTDEERNRRTNLSAVEKQNLEKWGYPYVGDRFRFHMTLTSSLNETELDAAEEMLAGNVPASHVTVDSICVLGDPGDAKPFEVLERFDLKA